MSNGRGAFRLGQLIASVSELFCTIYKTQQFQTIFLMLSLDAFYSKKRIILKKLNTYKYGACILRMWGL